MAASIVLREGIKKKFFLGDLSQIWVGGGADSQTLGGIYQPLFLSPKVPKCGWAVKTQKNHKDTGRTQRHRRGGTQKRIEKEKKKTGLRRRRKKQD